jgi:hypothetical protein
MKLLLVGVAHALQPLATVYHYPAEGDWLGARIPDAVVEDLRAHRRLATAAVSLRGDVALTTATGTVLQQNGAAVGTCASPAKCSFAIDEDVYGPFEAGFGTQQDNVIASSMGCSDTTKCYSEGGMDVATAEAICAQECGITLPRTESGVYYAFLDSCGGHTNDYHFHRNLDCLYTQAAGSAHSAQIAKVLGGGSSRRLVSRRLPGCDDGAPPVCSDGTTAAHPPTTPPCASGPPSCADGTVLGGPGGGGAPPGSPPPSAGGGGAATVTANGQFLYGQWEDFSSSTRPLLDACGGSYGVTPDSAGASVYHYVSCPVRVKRILPCVALRLFVTHSVCIGIGSTCRSTRPSHSVASGPTPTARW